MGGGVYGALRPCVCDISVSHVQRIPAVVCSLIFSRSLENLGFLWRWHWVPTQTYERCCSYWTSSKRPNTTPCQRHGFIVNRVLLIIIVDDPDVEVITSSTIYGAGRRFTRLLFVRVRRLRVSSKIICNVGAFTLKRTWSGRCMETPENITTIVVGRTGISARGLREPINKA